MACQPYRRGDQRFFASLHFFLLFVDSWILPPLFAVFILESLWSKPRRRSTPTCNLARLWAAFGGVDYFVPPFPFFFPPPSCLLFSLLSLFYPPKWHSHCVRVEGFGLHRWSLSCLGRRQYAWNGGNRFGLPVLGFFFTFSSPFVYSSGFGLFVISIGWRGGFCAHLDNNIYLFRDLLSCS